jgi:hypothetical protein
LAEDPRDLRLGGLVAPPASQATGANLLAVFDPWLAAALPYFQFALNSRLSQAYEAAMAGQATGAPGGKACLEVTCVDPAAYLGPEQLALPHLAIFPKSGTEAELTLHRSRVDTTYQAVYVLPALEYKQALRVEPILQGVLAVLFLASEEGCLPDYQDGALVWGAAGTTQVTVVSHTFARFEREGYSGSFPCLVVELRVRNQERYDASKAPDLAVIYERTDAADPDAGDLTIAELNTEFPP